MKKAQIDEIYLQIPGKERKELENLAKLTPVRKTEGSIKRLVVDYWVMSKLAKAAGEKQDSGK